MIWKYLYREGVGAHRRCLDIGSGSGLLAVQLARNGAAARARDRCRPAAVSNTLTNAFRNGVAERVSAACVDLYPWVPEERYDVIVASLSQAPGDPFAPVVSHRPRDFWGRNLIDHLIGCCPRRSRMTASPTSWSCRSSGSGGRSNCSNGGLLSRVVDFAFVGVDEDGEQELDQITRVEERSDAYHLKLGERRTMVAYLLEVTRSRQPLRLTCENA